MRASVLNQLVADGMRRAARMEPRLAAALTPLLERAGNQAASAFQQRATNHLTASLRRADAAIVRDVGIDAARQLVASLGLRAAAGVTSQSTMVCVKPRPDEAQTLADPDGEPADLLHVTLVYIGETTGPLQPIADAVAGVAASHAPLAGIVGGYGQFGTPGDAPPVGILLPDVPGLVELRVAVTEALAAKGIDYARSHGFEAHITVDTSPEPGEGDDELPRAYGQPLHFDQLLVVRGDTEVISLPLVGRPPVTAAGEPPPWSAPAPDELLDVKALIASLRTKLDPVRLAVVKTMFDGVVKARAALTFAGGTVEDVARFDVRARAMIQAGLELDTEDTQLYSRVSAALEREIEAAGFPDTAAGSSALSEAFTAMDRVTVDAVKVLRSSSGKMLGLVSYNPGLTPAELADAREQIAQLDSDIAANNYADEWFGSAEEQRAADIQLRDAMKADVEQSEKFNEFGVNHLASTGAERGIGARLMREIAREAADRGVGVGLNSLPDSEGFYRRLGMTQEPGTHNFHWTADEAAQFAKTGVVADAAAAVGLHFDVTNPFTARLFERTASQVTHIADTTQLNVMRIVRESYEQGLSIPDTAKAIRAGMHDATPARARLIARTELVGAVNGGSLAAMQIVGAATDTAYTKTWLTAPGAKDPRHELYEDLDGQTVPLDGMFNVGGFELAHPGDPNGPPEEVCNCRCAMSFTDAGGEGDLSADEG